MQKGEQRLLGLRQRMTAPSLLGRSAEPNDDPSSGTSSRYSSSPRSADNFRCRESPPDVTTTFPFPVAEESENDNRGLVRRPSEHFLEVLEREKGQTLPRIQAKARRRVTHSGCPREFEPGARRRDEGLTGDGTTDVQQILNALNGGNICSYKHLKTRGTDSGSAGGQECLNDTRSRKTLSRVTSLPEIVPRSMETSCGTITTTAPPRERLSRFSSDLAGSSYAASAERDSPGSCTNGGQDIAHEKYGMIREWLKECEEARTSFPARGAESI